MDTADQMVFREIRESVDGVGANRVGVVADRLAAEFGPADLEWRVQTDGKKGDRVWALVVPYISNRAIMERLDSVLGIGNWQNEFKAGPAGGVLCGISIRIMGSWGTRWDGADNTDIEPVKGGISGAMKRAAVQWGIGRYLYAMDSQFADVHENGKHYVKAHKDVPAYRWDPPSSSGGRSGREWERGMDDVSDTRRPAHAKNQPVRTNNQPDGATTTKPAVADAALQESKDAFLGVMENRLWTPSEKKAAQSLVAKANLTETRLQERIAAAEKELDKRGKVAHGDGGAF